MSRLLLVFCILFLSGSLSYSQISFTELSPVPEPISNTAISAVEVDGQWFVYAFSGIDSTKLFSGIHAKAFRYDVTNDSWSKIADLPSGQDRIAAGASTIRGKIYILGGYEVFANSTEVSINNLHVYDPLTDTYEMDATPIPTPIDDQVQFVYKDSLIYSVTGWSNNGNVGDVWIYDAVNNTWQEGTNIPTTPAFKAFGASGTVVGDTIYFIGGARDTGNFGIGDRLRKGYINPLDPSDITWSNTTNENAKIYRSGAGVFQGKPFWLGGSENTYNYDGIAYNGAGGVPPTDLVIFYDPVDGTLNKTNGNFPVIMDFRGLAQISDNTFISVGGMVDNQVVTNRVMRYDFTALVHTEQQELYNEVTISPNPNQGIFTIEIPGNEQIDEVQVFDLSGKNVYEGIYEVGKKLDLSHLENGTYYVILKGLKNKDFRSVFMKF